MEINREQIVKALECCTKPNCVGYECPLYGDQAACVTGLNIAALSLIKQLTEENLRLQTDYNELYELTAEEIKSLNEDKEWAAKRIIEADKKVAELTEENEKCKEAINQVNFIADVTKVVTVWKMHELIKERCIEGGVYPAFVANTIDQIAKEMLES